jgi:hypothetical protein
MYILRISNDKISREKFKKRSKYILRPAPTIGSIAVSEGGARGRNLKFGSLKFMSACEFDRNAVEKAKTLV